MRIGIDARFIGASSYGLAQYSENLLTALSQIDSSNEYTVFVNAGLKRKLKIGSNFQTIPIRGRPLSAKGIARMRMALRRESFDLVHSHFPLVPLGSDLPALVTVHDVVPFRPSGAFGRRVPLWDRLGSWFLYPMTMSRARWILCVSHATRRSLLEIYPQTFHKTIVVQSGVEDLYRVRTEPATGALLHSRLSLPDSYLLYSGSSGYTKNIPLMIEAFAALRRTEPRAGNHHFVLDLTEGQKEVTEIERTAERFGVKPFIRIMTRLSVEERRLVFEQASLLFMASMTEGFCFPAIRAQLCGVPIVAADAGALPEICGEGSLLVDPANMEEMVAMLGRALFDEDLREYLKDQGLENARRFSWTETAKEVKQIYELLF